MVAGVVWGWVLMGIGAYRWANHPEEATACAILIGSGMQAACISGGAGQIAEVLDQWRLQTMRYLESR